MSFNYLKLCKSVGVSAIKNGKHLSQFYRINEKMYGLTDAQIQLRERVFNFVQKELAPKANEIDRKDHFDDLRNFWKKLGNLGLLGITVKSEYGGTDGSYLDHVITHEEITRASSSIALSYGVHSNSCVDQIHRNGTEEQKRKYLPKLCSGEYIGATAITEKSFGCDVVSMSLKAEKDGDFYILNGNKTWITNGLEADVLVVYARTNTKSEAKHGISTFLVEKRFPGFSIGPKLDKLGHRGSNTCELIFENCRVPKENLLGVENKGVHILMKGLDYERIVFSGMPVGTMQACCDVAFNYAHERKKFGKRIGEFQIIQSKMANMYTTLSACRSYLYNVARACDKKHINAKDGAGLSMYCAEKSTQMTLDAIQILGADGCHDIDYPAGRLLRDSKAYEIGAGTVQMRKLIIGRALNNEYS